MIITKKLLRFLLCSSIQWHLVYTKDHLSYNNTNPVGTKVPNLHHLRGLILLITEEKRFTSMNQIELWKKKTNLSCSFNFRKFNKYFSRGDPDWIRWPISRI